MCNLRTHRGFAVAKPESVKDDDVKYVVVGGFRDVAVKLANSPNALISADEQLPLIKEAIRAMKATKFSLKDQIESPMGSTPEIINFVESTLDYLTNGVRRLPIILWADLLDHLPESFTEVPSVRRRELYQQYQDLLDMPIHELVRLWVSQPGGIHDLALTMDLVFSDKDGDVKPVMTY